jgi:hypothetical protein
MSLSAGHAAETDEPRANPNIASSRDCVQRRPADVRRRELCSGRGIERQKDGDVPLVPSPITCSELSVLVRLPGRGSQETEGGTIGGGGGGDLWLRG